MNNLSLTTEQALFEIGFARQVAGKYIHLQVPIIIENRAVWNIAMVDGKIQTFFLTEKDLVAHLLSDNTDEELMSRLFASGRKWWGGVAALHV